MTTEPMTQTAPAPTPPEAGPDLGAGLAPVPRWRGLLTLVPLYLLAIAVALGLSAVLVQATGSSASATFNALYQGSLQDGASIGQTIDEATPLLLVALGTLISTRAGIFNIGQEGQLLIGAMIGAAVGLHVGGWGWAGTLVTLLASAAGGAFWAGIAALLRYWRRVDVVISTLLLTFVAAEVVTFAVNRSWLLQETAMPGAILASESNQLPEDVRLAHIGEYPNLNFGAGCFLALGLAVAVLVVLNQTRWGFRLRMLGLNRVVAHRAGVNEARTGSLALVLSGAFAGMAGGVMLTGSVFRIQAGFSNNVGNEGLLVALVSQGSAIVAVPVAFFFGALRSGGGFLASTGVPRYLVDVVQSLLVLAAVFPSVYRARRRLRRLLTGADGAAPAAPAAGGSAA